MSDRLKSTANVSNEDVIEGLTKNLQAVSTENENVEEFVINPEHSSAEISPEQEQTEFKTDFSEFDTETDNDEHKDGNSDSESELALKDAEVDLTDDQKEERRRTAEELKAKGNTLFMEGQYEQSVEKYTEALRICPLQFAQQRSVLFCNRSAARLKLERYKQAVKDCTKALELDDKYMKAYIRRAQSYEALEKYDESLSDYKKILELDPSHKDALRATVRLPPLIEEKNEKLKTEMLGKLKDLGNMILKPFGLSTENFQLEQDPESKGYKINFKQ